MVPTMELAEEKAEVGITNGTAPKDWGFMVDIAMLCPVETVWEWTMGVMTWLVWLSAEGKIGRWTLCALICCTG